MRRLFPASLGFLKQLPVELPQLLLALLSRALQSDLRFRAPGSLVIRWHPRLGLEAVTIIELALPLELFDLELMQGLFLTGVRRRVLRPALLLQHAEHEFVLLLLPHLLMALQLTPRRLRISPCQSRRHDPRKTQRQPYPESAPHAAFDRRHPRRCRRTRWLCRARSANR